MRFGELTDLTSILTQLFMFTSHLLLNLSGNQSVNYEAAYCP